MMKSFEWANPRTLTDAASAGTGVTADAMLGKDGNPPADGVILKAGGIDLLDLMKEGLLKPRRIVNLQSIPGLDRISQDKNGEVRIGANVTLARIAGEPLLQTRYRALADAAGRSASPQIRAVATIGGNLLQRPRCWYFRSRHHHCARKGGSSCFAFGGENQYHAIFDHHGCAIVHPSTAATALVALDARLELVQADGTKRTVDLEKFFVLPDVDVHRENILNAGEIITAIVLPAQSRQLTSIHLKHSGKDSFDWPTADVAVVLARSAKGICERASIILGAAAPVPHRAKAAEAALVGKRINEQSARAAAAAALAGAAPLSRNAYKLPIFETLIRRAILAIAG